jgi:ATP-dependent RNA helicase DeaD
MTTETIRFTDLALSEPVLKAIADVGYEQPSPIQAESIPHLLNGDDLLGLAQTGTGKTAAFALPLLTRVDMKLKTPQILVLAPTRELAIQVSEAFQTYAKNIKGFHVLPIYGGQSFDTQLRGLRRGVQVIVGTADHPVTLFYVFTGACFAGNRNFFRVALIAFGNATNFFRHGGREECGLTLFWSVF